MTPHPIVRPVGSIIGSEKDFGGMCSCISCRFLIRSVSCLSRLPTWSFFSGTLPGEVPRVDRDGSEKFPGSERSVTFHIPYHDVSR